MTLSTPSALAKLAGGHLFILYNRCRLISYGCCLEEIVLHHFTCKFQWEVTQLASHAPPQPGLPTSFPSTLLLHAAHTYTVHSFWVPSVLQLSFEAVLNSVTCMLAQLQSHLDGLFLSSEVNVNCSGRLFFEKTKLLVCLSHHCSFRSYMKF